MTNRECLNSLSDEEFAEYLDCTSSICNLCICANSQEKCYDYNCKDGHLQWLKQEHKE